MSMKVCPCMCSHSSFPSWGNDWHNIMRYLAISGEFCLLQTVTNLAVCHKSIVNQQCAACSGSPHYDQLSQVERLILPLFNAYQE